MCVIFTIMMKMFAIHVLEEKCFKKKKKKMSWKKKNERERESERERNRTTTTVFEFFFFLSSFNLVEALVLSLLTIKSGFFFFLNKTIKSGFRTKEQKLEPSLKN
jgi:hypothetical protein